MSKERIEELQKSFDSKASENNDLISKIDVDGESVVVPDGVAAAIQANNAEMAQIKSLLMNLREADEIQQWAAEPAEAKSVAQEVYAEREEVSYSPMEYKSAGEQFVESQEYLTYKTQNPEGGGSMNEPFFVKDIVNITPDRGFNPDGQTPDRFRNIQRIPGIITSPERKRRIRELFPVRKTNATNIEFFRKVGFTYPEAAAAAAARATNNAGVVPQSGSSGLFTGSGLAGGVVQKSQLSFISEAVQVRTLAHWEAVHRHVMADEPTLRGVIDNELMYGLRLLEDEQILYGSGSGEELFGIMARSGRSGSSTPGAAVRTVNDANIYQTYLWSSGETTPVVDTKADAIRRSLTLSYLSYYEPTGIIMNPSDLEDLELTKSTEGLYLMAANLYTGAESRIWRVPIIDTPAIDEGEALVGSFGMGATLHDRMQMSIRASDQHADFFIRMAMAVLAEERLALCVPRPESFVRVVFDNAPS